MVGMGQRHPLRFPEVHLRIGWQLESNDGRYDRGLRTWRGFGLEHGELVEDPEITPGRGYWLSTALPDDQIEVTGLPLPDTVAVPLSAGWSAIGVPNLEIGFAWSEVEITAGDERLSLSDSSARSYVQPRVHWFFDPTANLDNSDGGYEASEVASGHSSDNHLGGYLVYAHQACTLILPNAEGVDLLPGCLAIGRSTREVDSQPVWSLEVAAATSHSHERKVIVGTWSGCRSGWDRRDALKPPFFLEGVELSIIQEGCSWPEYMRAYDAPDAVRHEWTLRVSGDDDVAALRWSGLDRVPQGFGVYLIDPQRDHAVDMRATSVYDFVLAGAEREFSLLVDSEPYAGRILSARPTTLHAISPNPTAGDVRIAYEVGMAGTVDVRIFDLTGRQVMLLDAGLRDRGHYDLLWHPNRMKLSAGLYFVRLRSGNVVQTRRFVRIQ